MSNYDPESRAFYLAGTGFSPRNILEKLSPSSRPIGYEKLVQLYAAAAEANGWNVHRTQAWIREEKDKKMIDLTVGEADELIEKLRSSADEA